jgi:predicted kinase
MKRLYVYDAGMLIAMEKADGKALDKHRRFLRRGAEVIVPAVVAAQAVRRPARQAQLMRTLNGAKIEPFTNEHHAAVGKLLADSGTSDVVDAFVALLAARVGAVIFTSDTADIKHLVKTLGADVPVLAA